MGILQSLGHDHCRGDGDSGGDGDGVAIKNVLMVDGALVPVVIVIDMVVGHGAGVCVVMAI